MKKIRILSVICLVILSCFIFASCGFGSYDLEFVLPDGTVYKTHTYGPGDSLTTVSSAPNIMGFDFLGWSETEDGSVIKLPYDIKANKLYARYEIDDNMFYGYNTIDFEENSADLTVTKTLQNYYIIKINDISTSKNISRVEVFANDNDFLVGKMELYNQNGKLLNDNNSSNSAYTINEGISATNTSSYVLIVEAIINNDFTICIN